MIGSRGEAAALTTAGLAVTGSYLWFPHMALLIVGVLITVLGSSGLVSVLRWSPEKRRQEMMIRDLWSTARRWPSGLMLRDPVTGSGISVERERGFLTLAITDPLDRDDLGEGRVTTVTWYVLGFLAAPEQPSLLRHTTALHDASPARMSWQQAGELLHFNDLTGAMDATSDELAELRAQLDRTIAATTNGGGAAAN